MLKSLHLIIIQNFASLFNEIELTSSNCEKFKIHLNLFLSEKIINVKTNNIT